MTRDRRIRKLEREPVESNEARRAAVCAWHEEGMRFRGLEHTLSSCRRDLARLVDERDTACSVLADLLLSSQLTPEQRTAAIVGLVTREG